MSKEQILKNVENVIKVIAKDIKKRKSAKSDEVRQLTGLVNSYTRLSGSLEPSVKLDDENGDQNYYDQSILKHSGC